MPEPIADLTVEISGDYSKLENDLSQAVSIGADGGQKIASAFNAAAAGASTLEERVQALIDSGSTLAQALKTIEQQDAALAESMNEVSKAAQSAAQEMVPLDQALSAFVESAGEKGKVDALNSAFEEFANTAGTLDSSLNEVRQTAAESFAAFNEGKEATIGWSEAFKLAGFTIGLETIKELATAALEAYEKIERSTVALTALTGSAGGAEREISALKDLALQDALSFPALLQADQRMLAFGISSQQAKVAIHAAADAAAATGNDFNALASSLTRIAETGTASTRNLFQLGISMKDLAEAMGVTEGEAKKAFQALDQSERLEVLERALNKFSGTAKALAEQLPEKNLVTQIQFALQDIGQALDPVVDGLAVLATQAVRTADISAKAFGQLTSEGAHLADAIGTTVKNISAANPEFQKLADAASKIAVASDNAGAKQQGLTSIMTAQVPVLGALVSEWKLFADTLDLINAKAPNTNDLLNNLSANLEKMTHAMTTSNPAFQRAWELSQQFTNALGAVHSKQVEVNTAIDNAKRVLDAYSESYRQHKPLADGHVATAGEVRIAQKNLEDALRGATIELNSEKEAIKRLSEAYKEFDIGADNTAEKVGNLANTFDRANAAFSGTIRTLIGSFQQQSEAFQNATIQAGRLAAEDEKLFDVINGGIRNINPAIGELADKLGHWPTLAEQVAAGLDNIVGGARKIVPAMEEADTSTVTAFHNMVVAMDPAMQAMKSFIEATNAARASFGDLSSEVLSFHSQLGLSGEGGTATGGKGGGKSKAGQRMANGDFNTGFTLPPHTHLDYGMWGIRGAQVVPDTGWYYDWNGDLVQFDPESISRQQSKGGSVTPPPAASGPKLSDDVTKFIAQMKDMLSATGEGAFIGVSGGMERISDLIAKAISSNAIPQEYADLMKKSSDSMDALSTSVNKSADKISASIATLTPVMDTVGAQIKASVEQQSASFQRLSDVLSPVASPTSANTGTPASFMRVGAEQVSSRNMTTVNNMQITATPALQDLMDKMKDELQRIGVRF